MDPMFGRRMPVLACGQVVVRGLRPSDEGAWTDLLHRNRTWLRPWEATLPGSRPLPAMPFRSFVRLDRRMWRKGRALAMAIEFEGELVGRVAITGIEWGSACNGSMGYWIDEGHAGRGIVPHAAALLVHYAFSEGLHRVEIAARPENVSSLRVAKKLGFRDEGLRRRYLYIDGDWRDHRVFALTSDERRLGDLWRCEG
jgi:ribosomal-protein-alanine N-acetyltransferase